ncbi:hypothetical protein D3C76_1509810 [compost metagenome]
MLQVQQNQIRILDQLLKLGLKAFFGAVAAAGAVHGSMNAAGLALAEEVNQKIHLEQRLAAADGNPAAGSLDERKVAFEISHNLIRCHHLARADFPCIRIVAV